MSALRRAIDWTFRDRNTGAIVIGQWPNPPLWLFLGFSAARWAVGGQGLTETLLRAGSGIALAWWAADEILRGVNPWRRFLGASALAALAVFAARTMLSPGTER